MNNPIVESSSLSFAAWHLMIPFLLWMSDTETVLSSGLSLSAFRLRILAALAFSAISLLSSWLARPIARLLRFPHLAIWTCLVQPAWSVWATAVLDTTLEHTVTPSNLALASSNFFILIILYLADHDTTLSSGLAFSGWRLVMVLLVFVISWLSPFWMELGAYSKLKFGNALISSASSTNAVLETIVGSSVFYAITPVTNDLRSLTSDRWQGLTHHFRCARSRTRRRATIADKRTGSHHKETSLVMSRRSRAKGPNLSRFGRNVPKKVFRCIFVPAKFFRRSFYQSIIVSSSKAIIRPLCTFGSYCFRQFVSPLLDGGGPIAAMLVTRILSRLSEGVEDSTWSVLLPLVVFFAYVIPEGHLRSTAHSACLGILGALMLASVAMAVTVTLSSPPQRQRRFQRPRALNHRLQKTRRRRMRRRNGSSSTLRDSNESTHQPDRGIGLSRQQEPRKNKDTSSSADSLSQIFVYGLSKTRLLRVDLATTTTSDVMRRLRESSTPISLDSYFIFEGKIIPDDVALSNFRVNGQPIGDGCNIRLVSRMRGGRAAQPLAPGFAPASFERASTKDRYGYSREGMFFTVDNSKEAKALKKDSYEKKKTAFPSVLHHPERDEATHRWILPDSAGPMEKVVNNIPYIARDSKDASIQKTWCKGFDAAGLSNPEITYGADRNLTLCQQLQNVLSNREGGQWDPKGDWFHRLPGLGGNMKGKNCISTGFNQAQVGNAPAHPITQSANAQYPETVRRLEKANALAYEIGANVLLSTFSKAELLAAGFRADQVNSLTGGPGQNRFFGSIQYNFTAPDVDISSENGIGNFGGQHVDKGDDADLLTVVLVLSVLKGDTYPGGFALVEPPVFLQPNGFAAFAFGGTNVHGGMAPKRWNPTLATETVDRENEECRITVVLYPNKKGMKRKRAADALFDRSDRIETVDGPVEYTTVQEHGIPASGGPSSYAQLMVNEAAIRLVRYLKDCSGQIAFSINEAAFFDSIRVHQILPGQSHPANAPVVPSGTEDAAITLQDYEPLPSLSTRQFIPTHSTERCIRHWEDVSDTFLVGFPDIRTHCVRTAEDTLQVMLDRTLEPLLPSSGAATALDAHVANSSTLKNAKAPRARTTIRQEAAQLPPNPTKTNAELERMRSRATLYVSARDSVDSRLSSTADADPQTSADLMDLDPEPRLAEEDAVTATGLGSLVPQASPGCGLSSALRGEDQASSDAMDIDPELVDEGSMADADAGDQESALESEASMSSVAVTSSPLSIRLEQPSTSPNADSPHSDPSVPLAGEESVADSSSDQPSLELAVDERSGSRRVSTRLGAKKPSSSLAVTPAQPPTTRPSRAANRRRVPPPRPATQLDSTVKPPRQSGKASEGLLIADSSPPAGISDDRPMIDLTEPTAPPAPPQRKRLAGPPQPDDHLIDQVRGVLSVERIQEVTEDLSSEWATLHTHAQPMTPSLYRDILFTLSIGPSTIQSLMTQGHSSMSQAESINPNRWIQMLATILERSGDEVSRLRVYMSVNQYFWARCILVFKDLYENHTEKFASPIAKHLSKVFPIGVSSVSSRVGVEERDRVTISEQVDPYLVALFEILQAQAGAPSVASQAEWDALPVDQRTFTAAAASRMGMPASRSQELLLMPYFRLAKPPVLFTGSASARYWNRVEGQLSGILRQLTLLFKVRPYVSVLTGCDEPVNAASSAALHLRSFDDWLLAFEDQAELVFTLCDGFQKHSAADGHEYGGEAVFLIPGVYDFIKLRARLFTRSQTRVKNVLSKPQRESLKAALTSIANVREVREAVYQFHTGFWKRWNELQTGKYGVEGREQSVQRGGNKRLAHEVALDNQQPSKRVRQTLAQDKGARKQGTKSRKRAEFQHSQDEALRSLGAYIQANCQLGSPQDLSFHPKLRDWISADPDRRSFLREQAPSRCLSRAALDEMAREKGCSVPDLLRTPIGLSNVLVARISFGQHLFLALEPRYYSSASEYKAKIRRAEALNRHGIQASGQQLKRTASKPNAYHPRSRNIDLIRTHDTTAYGSSNSRINPKVGSSYFDLPTGKLDGKTVAWTELVGAYVAPALVPFMVCHEWIGSTKLQNFQDDGGLMRLLVVEDLVYGGLVQPPTVAEMASLVYQINRGCVAALDILKLPVSTGSVKGELSEESVIESFTKLHAFLQQHLPPPMQQQINFDVIMTEHLGCKLSRGWSAKSKESGLSTGVPQEIVQYNGMRLQPLTLPATFDSVAGDVVHPQASASLQSSLDRSLAELVKDRDSLMARIREQAEWPNEEGEDSADEGNKSVVGWGDGQDQWVSWAGDRVEKKKRLLKGASLSTVAPEISAKSISKGGSRRHKRGSKPDAQTDLSTLALRPAESAGDASTSTADIVSRARRTSARVSSERTGLSMGVFGGEALASAMDVDGRGFRSESVLTELSDEDDGGYEGSEDGGDGDGEEEDQSGAWIEGEGSVMSDD